MHQPSATMFDLVSDRLDRPFRNQRVAASIVSVTSHLAVLGGVVSALVIGISEKVPEVPTMIAFVAEAPAPMPPPPPPAPALRIRTERTPAPARPTPASGQAFIAPLERPAGIQTDRAMDFDDEGGVAGGVPGGIPGGVVGGIVGNVLADVPPPFPPPLTPTRVGGAIQEPALVHRVEPDYPELAVRAKVSGTVILEATVNETGEVTHVSVLRSLPLLDNSAIDAVKQWRYEPLRLNGVASPFILTVTLTFSIK